MLKCTLNHSNVLNRIKGNKKEKSNLTRKKLNKQKIYYVHMKYQLLLRSLVQNKLAQRNDRF